METMIPLLMVMVIVIGIATYFIQTDSITTAVATDEDGIYQNRKVR